MKTDFKAIVYHAIDGILDVQKYGILKSSCFILMLAKVITLTLC